MDRITEWGCKNCNTVVSTDEMSLWCFCTIINRLKDIMPDYWHLSNILYPRS